MTVEDDALAKTEAESLRGEFAAATPGEVLERERMLNALHRRMFGVDKGEVRVGRFVLGDKLGAGAMGIVYVARDPKLDREVAVKVLHPHADPQVQRDNHARLLREAKTLARLTHPNVVAVHEVGESGDELFIAMQLIDGASLGAWLKQEARPWPEILRLFVGAGQGLAAAHRQELVHRDFKPDNVLVDREGHPRVADFGLACSIVDATDTPTEELDSPLERVTQSGSLVGTPVYMAPELFDGQPADALSDQYAYCVALYEALYGVRPFEGKTLAGFIERAQSMTLSPPKPGRTAPAWLRRIVLRGLSPDPDARFASMDALLAAIERGRHRGRRLLVGGLAGLAGVSAIAAVLAYDAGVRNAVEQPPCPTADALRETIWDAPRRTALADAFGSDARAYVGHAGEGALRELDAWAQRWADARHDACLATHERAEQSETLLDLRVQCYEIAATGMHGLVDAMATSPEAKDAAPQVTASLPDLRLCADDDWVASRRPLPRGDDARERIEAASRSLAEAEVLNYAGKHEEVLARSEAALAEAEALEYEPLAADALELTAKAHGLAGRPEQATTALTQALTRALASGNEWRAAHTAVALISRTDSKAERERWTTVAEGVVAKLGSPADLVGDIALASALAQRSEGDPESALVSAREALEQFSRVYGVHHAKVAHATEEIGIALDMLGHSEEAVAQVERSLAVETEVWGAEHPRVGASHINLGIMYGQLGRIDDCAATLERGVEILEAAHGPDSINIAPALTNLANVREMQQRYEDALSLNERALAIRVKVYGEDSEQAAINLANGGSTLTGLERYDEAERWLQRALAIRIRELGPDHPMTANAEQQLGAALAHLQRWDDAIAQHRAAAEAWTKSLGPEHPLVGVARLHQGENEARAGQREAGLSRMRKGLAIIEAARGPDHPDVATARRQIAAIEAL